MIPDEYELLLQAELDGENTRQASARLHAWLARSPEGRARLRELEAVFHALARVERAEVPADLRHSILGAIESEAPGTALPSGWGEAFSAAFARHPALRQAYPFAAGLVLGLAAFALLGRVLPGPPREPLPVAGTMAPIRGTGGGSVTERRLLRAGETDFTVETWRSGDAIELRLGGGPAQAVQVTVVFDPQRLTALGVQWSPSARAHLELGPGRLALGFTGYAPVVARFRAAGTQDAQLRVTFRTAGRSGEVALRTGR